MQCEFHTSVYFTKIAEDPGAKAEFKLSEDIIVNRGGEEKHIKQFSFFFGPENTSFPENDPYMAFDSVSGIGFSNTTFVGRTFKLEEIDVDKAELIYTGDHIRSQGEDSSGLGYTFKDHFDKNGFKGWITGTVKVRHS